MAEATPFSNVMSQAQGLPPARLAILVATGVGSMAFFLWLAFGAVNSDYRLLYRGLAEDEAGEVVEALDAERIPYELADGGTSIRVPANQVYEARIRVARKGLPHGGGAGFEIFDRQGFGVTDFVQRVNYRRALQGELARSIEQLETVERARVQIALPERSNFVGVKKLSPSASVVLALRGQGMVEEAQVMGIVHLVASSVVGLDSTAVTVVDNHGRLLAPDGGGGGGASAPAGAHGHQARLERELGDRVETILGRTVGVGSVVARVRAEMDWTQTEVTEERFDPDSQVARSEQVNTDSSNERRAQPAGIPGVFGNSPDTDVGLEPDSSFSTTKSSETINYEITKTISHTVAPVGGISRLYLAVLVDGKPSATPPAEGEEATFVPWSSEELQQFEDLAKQAVGFSEERGDQITVTSAPFRTIAIEEEEGTALLGPDALVLVGTLVRALALLIALVLFARMVVRPLISALLQPEGAGAPMRAGDLEMQLAGGGLPAGAPIGAGGALPAGAPMPSVAPPMPTLAERVGSVAEQRREDSVKTIRNWLHQR